MFGKKKINTLKEQLSEFLIDSEFPTEVRREKRNQKFVRTHVEYRIVKKLNRFKPQSKEWGWNLNNTYDPNFCIGSKAETSWTDFYYNDSDPREISLGPPDNYACRGCDSICEFNNKTTAVEFLKRHFGNKIYIKSPDWKEV